MSRKIRITCITFIMLCPVSGCYSGHMPNRFLEGEQRKAVVESMSTNKRKWEQRNNYLIRQTNGVRRIKRFAGDTSCGLKVGDTITIFVMKSGEFDSPSFY